MMSNLKILELGQKLEQEKLFWEIPADTQFQPVKLRRFSRRKILRFGKRRTGNKIKKTLQT